MIDNYRIVKLIYKHLSKTASGAEEEELQKWIKSTGNDDIIRELSSSKRYKEKHKQYELFETDKGLQRVKAKIEKQEARKEKTLVLFSKYAAMLALLIVSGFAIYTVIFTDTNNPSLSIADIPPGTKKAMLYLGNGMQIDLQEQQDSLVLSFGVTIKNVNHQLSFDHGGVEESTGVETKYNVLAVPNGGEYKVILQDGTIVWVNAGSTLKFPLVFDDDIRLVELEGEAYFEVQKDNKPFIVATGDLNVRVLGTKFNINAYQDNPSVATTLVEGSVSLASERLEEEALLTPGEQAVFDRSTADIEIAEVDTHIYTAWTEGKFYFQKEALQNILKRLGRWYDIKFEYEDEELREKLFTGVALKSKSLDDVLQLISKTTNIDYQIENKTITMMKDK